MTPKAKPQPRGWNSVVAWALSGHAILGLAMAAPLYVLCLSGTISVFADEIRRWEQPLDPVVTEIAPEVLGTTLNVVAAAGLGMAAAHGGGDEVFIEIPGGEFPRLLVQVASHETGAAHTWAADASGAIINEHATPWWNFMVGLHYQLHVPGLFGLPLGLFIVGALGVLMVSLILSGVLAHPRIFKDAFTLRWGGSKRLQEADIHNRLSVWGLPFHLAVAFSGAFLGLAPLAVSFLVPAAYGENAMSAYEEIYGPGPGAEVSAAPLPDLTPILAEVRRLTPDATIESIILQEVGTGGQLVHVTAHRADQLAHAERHFFSGEGMLLRTTGYDDGVAGLQWVAAMTPLHYGSFGGLPVKIAYGILGAALTLITATGVTIWLARLADKGRIRRGWQKIWSAVVWGQFFALGVSAMIALGPAASAVTPAYLAAMAAFLAVAALPLAPLTFSRLLRLAAAASMTLLVIVHVLTFGSMNDPTGWIVNAVLLAIAGLIAKSCRAAPKPA